MLRAKSKHFLVLFAILLVVGLFHFRITTFYFCGYDDFIDLRRAAFGETRTFLGALTLPSFEKSYKYRPLAVALNNYTYQLGNGSPFLFRTRNVVFHLMNVSLVYAIGVLLFGSAPIAGAAALLYGIYPLSNQPVVGSVWSVTICDAFFLLGLFLFLLSVHRPRHRLLWLSLGLFSGWVTLLAYDPELVLFGLMFLYLGVLFVFQKKWPVDGRYMTVMITLTILFVGSYFVMRALYLPPGHPHMAPIANTVKNCFVYAAAVLIPVDHIFANEMFGTPLPSEIVLKGQISPVWLATVLTPLVLIVAFIVLKRRMIASRLKTLAWPQVVFLALAIPVRMAPFVLYNGHPSETYLYIPLTFFLLIVCAALYKIMAPDEARPAMHLYFGVIGLVFLLSAASSWVRNSRVGECGDTANRILTGLPDKLNHGEWYVRLANMPGEPRSRIYGMYGYRGVETLGVGSYGGLGVQDAIQWSAHNPNITVAVLRPPDLVTQCADAAPDRSACFWVHSDGEVTEILLSANARRKEH